MSDKSTCKHEVVNRSIDGNHYCEDCGADFIHLDHSPGKIVFTPTPEVATLRDQFAMAAMVADALQSALIIMSYTAQGKTFNGKFPGIEEGVNEYYKTADAMLKARTV
jgi:hypothetical protein